jgi:hypothetical protein
VDAFSLNNAVLASLPSIVGICAGQKRPNVPKAAVPHFTFTDEEQLFRLLTIFSGGFTLGAVEAISYQLLAIGR